MRHESIRHFNMIKRIEILLEKIQLKEILVFGDNLLENIHRFFFYTDAKVLL